VAGQLKRGQIWALLEYVPSKLLAAEYVPVLYYFIKPGRCVMTDATLTFLRPLLPLL
jgi:hypothetical protein